MGNVYVVTYNCTFKCDTLNGVHTSYGAVGVGDIFTFSNKEKAIKFVEDKIEEEKKSKFGCPKYDKYDYVAFLSYSQNEYNSNGIKHTWLITKSKIR